MLNTQRHTQVITMTDAVVARGQRAWGRIKATAAEQRELWREVGEALLVGRRLHKADQKFSQWCKEVGFGDMDRRDRADALWLAQHWAVVSDGTTPPGLSHPHRIRVWFNEQKTTSILPADLAEVEAEKVETIELDQRSAERVAKVINRAKANDEGAEIAKRHVEALAKKHNTTPEKLEEAVAVTAPASLYHFSPAQIEMLESIKLTALDIARQDGLTLDQVANCFIYIANQIKKGEING